MVSVRAFAHRVACQTRKNWRSVWCLQAAREGHHPLFSVQVVGGRSDVGRRSNRPGDLWCQGFAARPPVARLLALGSQLGGLVLQGSGYARIGSPFLQAVREEAWQNTGSQVPGDERQSALLSLDPRDVQPPQEAPPSQIGQKGTVGQGSCVVPVRRLRAASLSVGFMWLWRTASASVAMVWS
jgi:hypothetical protein